MTQPIRSTEEILKDCLETVGGDDSYASLDYEKVKQALDLERQRAEALEEENKRIRKEWNEFSGRAEQAWKQLQEYVDAVFVCGQREAKLEAKLTDLEALVVEKDKALRYAKAKWLNEHGNKPDWPVPDVVNEALSLTPSDIRSQLDLKEKYLGFKIDESLVLEKQLEEARKELDQLKTLRADCAISLVAKDKELSAKSKTIERMREALEKLASPKYNMTIAKEVLSDTKQKEGGV